MSSTELSGSVTVTISQTYEYYQAIFGIYAGGWATVITGKEMCIVDIGFDQQAYDLLGAPLKVQSPGECCDACYETSGCGSWTFNIKTYECFLKTEYAGMSFFKLISHYL